MITKRRSSRDLEEDLKDGDENQVGKGRVDKFDEDRVEKINGKGV